MCSVFWSGGGREAFVDGSGGRGITVLIPEVCGGSSVEDASGRQDTGRGRLSALTLRGGWRDAVGAACSPFPGGHAVPKGWAVQEAGLCWLGCRAQLSLR